MPGNPYSSNEPGIGPLMRDIKNKICQDCDLVALLEDDSGMEVRIPGGGDFLHRPVGCWVWAAAGCWGGDVTT